MPSAVVEGIGLYGRILGFAFVLAATAFVSACGAVYDPNGFYRSVTGWADAPFSELALGAIGRGDFKQAEDFVNKGLTQNPNDPYVLYAAGLVYENTGRPNKARQAFENVIALRGDGSVTMTGPDGTTTRPLMDMAGARLRALETGRPGATAAARSPKPTAPAPTETGADAAMAKRFEVMRRLRDDGLVTDEEFRTRRGRNIGALLPLTQAPPAAGLERPVPKAEDVAERLRALRASFEQRAISAAEHAAERTMILDALLPANPSAVAKPAPPPLGVMEAGAAAGRLSRLHTAGLISADELGREKAAMEKAIRGPGRAPAVAKAKDQKLLVPPPASKAAAAKAAADRKAKAAKAGKEAKAGQGKAPARKPAAQTTAGSFGIHLASYNTREEAETGWNDIKARFDKDFDGLRPSIASAKIGAKGVTIYRLKAGPVADKAAATALCGKLNAGQQFCEATQF